MTTAPKRPVEMQAGRATLPMEISKSKMLAVVIAAGYSIACLVGTIVHEGDVMLGATNLLGCVLLSLVPLALIWFPDEIGSARGG